MAEVVIVGAPPPLPPLEGVDASLELVVVGVFRRRWVAVPSVMASSVVELERISCCTTTFFTQYPKTDDGREYLLLRPRTSWAINQVVARQGRDRDGIYLQSCKASDAAAGRHDADQNKCDLVFLYISPDIFIFVLFHPAKIRHP